MDQQLQTLHPLAFDKASPIDLLNCMRTGLNSNKKAIYDIDKLIERYIYAAPEIKEQVFFHGNTGDNGLINILSKYCSENNTINIEIHHQYTKFVKAFTQNKGFTY